ncbi:hypothetical protein [Fumia xinanensis]|uniref:Uncharacterized protein n=1 Tax=Fumia xinanensis TaxID=2763659 RepID=A0A926E2R1_9FIRM|nr:hypothetical protein [Fumia xinanensis]MBC8558483.1 hypothetical protein [Fumia xinanensis]
MARKSGAPGFIMPDALYSYTKPQFVQPDACGCGAEAPAMPERPSCGCGAEAASTPNCGCGCHGNNTSPSCRPIECTYDSDFDENAHKYRICCDANGCCCKYPCSCRNPFWPEFAHPRWLTCRDLYDGRADSCYSGDMQNCD